MKHEIGTNYLMSTCEENKETETAAWKACVTAFDEVNQQLNKINKPTE